MTRTSFDYFLDAADAIEAVSDDLQMDAIRAHFLRMGARERFSAGTNIFQYRGVTGTSTNSPADALRSWARAARRRHEKLNSGDPQA